jgi:hypothetical protein
LTSKVVAVQTLAHGGPGPRGFLEVPSATPPLSIGSIYRNGRPPSPTISQIPLGAAVTGFEGMGDTVYMRGPLKKLLAREKLVYLTNPWPQFFWDLPDVKMVRPTGCTLRTQVENINAMPESTWCDEPPGLRWFQYSYHNDLLSRGATPISVFMSQFAVTDPIDFSLPVNPRWMTARIASLPRPLAVVHPPCVRSEWPNPSRNPRMEYLQAVLDDRRDLHWVSVGWTQAGKEWPDGEPLRGVGTHFDHGELSIEELCALIGAARLVLCGPSFPLPLSAALGTPVLCIFGGSMPPRCLVDPRMGRRVGYAAPEPFCACFSHSHNCNKIIDPNTVHRELRRLMAS